MNFGLGLWTPCRPASGERDFDNDLERGNQQRELHAERRQPDRHALL
jgi:hypothetical protein